MSLLPPEKVGKRQETLQAQAKQSPKYRFYALYDKVSRAEVLWQAFQCCRLNAGAPGVDGQTFEDIEAYGVGKWLGELAQELCKKTYRPQAVRRVYIPKSEGMGRTSRSTFWVTPSAGAIRRRRAGPILGFDRRPRRFRG